MKKTGLISFFISVLGLMVQPALAAYQSGWSISTSYIWRLMEDADVSFTKGTPSKILQLDKNISHRQAVFHVNKNLTNRYTFKVGCMYQSPTPAFELDVSPLDISMADQSRGFVFARFLVDEGQEYSLRGEISQPARLIFTPLTKSQDKKLSDLFLQITEGGKLSIALLQGSNNSPRIFSIPLEGFFDISKEVLNDCRTMNKAIQNYRGEVSSHPDYISREPDDAAPKEYSLKVKDGTAVADSILQDESDKTDETTIPSLPENKPDSQDEDEPPNANKEQKTEVQLFEPGGGAASIGEDGKPITKDQDQADAADDNLGQAKSMKIDENGKPVTE